MNYRYVDRRLESAVPGNHHNCCELLNLGKPYPYPIFTGITFGDDRAEFDQAEQLEGSASASLAGSNRGATEIIRRDPGQLQGQP